MSQSDARLARLLNLAFDGLQRPSAWQEFLAGVVEAANCRIGFLWTFYPDTSDYREHLVSGLAPNDLQEFRRNWATRDPFLARVDVFSVPVGELVRGEFLCPDEELEQQEVYRRFLSKVGFHYGVGVRLSDQPHQSTVLTIGRPRSSGVMTEDEMELMRQLVAPLIRIVAVYEELCVLRLGNEGARRVLNRSSDAIFLVNHNGKVLFRNRQAEELLGRANGLLLVEGRLEAAEPAVHDQLRLAVQRQCATPAGVPEPPMRLRIPRGSGELPLFALVEPTAPSGDPLTAPAAAITVLDPGLEWQGLDNAILCQAFNLSPGEARLVSLLASGLTPREAATELNVSVGTVRAQLHSVFGKTGTGRQAELIQLALRIAGRRAV